MNFHLVTVQMLAACAGIAMCYDYFFLGALLCIASTMMAQGLRVQ